MKRIIGKKILSILVLTIVIGFVTPILTFGADVATNFEYSIQPGTKEWGNLNHRERVLASQIPENVLKNMSTEELVIAVLNYPCFIDMMFYNTYQEGFDFNRTF